MISAAPAAAAAVRRTTPLQPAPRNARVIRISDSHSCAVHGAPGIEKLNGSARGTAPCASIHSPVARCDQVSPSPSTAGEKADDGEQEDGDERDDEARNARFGEGSGARSGRRARASDMARERAGGAIKRS